MSAVYRLQPPDGNSLKDCIKVETMLQSSKQEAVMFFYVMKRSALTFDLILKAHCLCTQSKADICSMINLEHCRFFFLICTPLTMWFVFASFACDTNAYLRRQQGLDRIIYHRLRHTLILQSNDALFQRRRLCRSVVSGCITTQSVPSALSYAPHYLEIAGIWDKQGAGILVTAQSEAR